MPLSAANSLVAPIAAAVGLGLVALLRSVRRHRRPRANTDLTQKARFRLFYWPGFPGRGEFIRLIFAECATPYADVYRGMTFEAAAAECYNAPDRFAVPALEDRLHVDPATGRPLAFSQTTVICAYLAAECGGGRLLPAGRADALRAAVLMADVADVMEEGCKAWHALDYTAGYHEQAAATQPFVDRFVEQRLPKWLAHFARKLAQNNATWKHRSDEAAEEDEAEEDEEDNDGKNLFFAGAALSYADLAVFHVLNGLRSETSAGGGCQRQYEALAAPILRRFMRQVGRRKRIRAWLDSDACCAFTQTGPGF